MEFWLILSGVVLLLCIILLAFLLTPKKTKKATPKQIKKPVPPPTPQLPATTSIQTQKTKNLIEMEQNKRKRKEVREFADKYPVIATRFVRKWLWEGKKRK
jgi:flagellar biosynthesis/type III secretory pathway M-ring protein FliF/YscJ